MKITYILILLFFLKLLFMLSIDPYILIILSHFTIFLNIFFTNLKIFHSNQSFSYMMLICFCSFNKSSQNVYILKKALKFNRYSYYFKCNFHCLLFFFFKKCSFDYFVTTIYESFIKSTHG